MKVAVWDTYFPRKDGKLMHFDIIVPAALKDQEVILAYGREYLAAKTKEGQTLSTKECRFCHYEQINEDWKNIIQQKGYYIYEMENCN